MVSDKRKTFDCPASRAAGYGDPALQLRTSPSTGEMKREAVADKRKKQGQARFLKDEKMCQSLFFSEFLSQTNTLQIASRCVAGDCNNES